MIPLFWSGSTFWGYSILLSHISWLELPAISLNHQINCRWPYMHKCLALYNGVELWFFTLNMRFGFPFNSHIILIEEPWSLIVPCHRHKFHMVNLAGMCWVFLKSRIPSAFQFACLCKRFQQALLARMHHVIHLKCTEQCMAIQNSTSEYETK